MAELRMGCKVRLGTLCLLIAFFLGAISAAAQDNRRLRAAYTSFSGNMTPLWAARDGGYFKKYGLDIDLISMPSGNEGMNALIAGELEFLAIAGSTTASAAIGGAEVVALATTIDHLVASLVVVPSIQRPEDLKGKSVGISRFGTSIDTAARMAIQHFKMEPIKDVSIVQIGPWHRISPRCAADEFRAPFSLIRQLFKRAARGSVRCSPWRRSDCPTHPPALP